MHRIRHITAPLIVCCLAAAGAGFFLTPDRLFSENENRVLKTGVSLSLQEILQGELDHEVESYLTDQMPLRDSMVQLSSDVRRLLGQKKIGDVYLAKEGYLISAVTREDLSLQQQEKNIAAFNDFFQSCGLAPSRITVLPVPDAGLILSEHLPAGAQMYDGDGVMRTLSEELQGCELVDVRPALSALSQSGVPVFYRTDHHWTTAAAREVYSACRGRFPAPFEDSLSSGERPALKTVSDRFHGSLYSKVLCSGIPYDTVQVPDPAGDPQELTVRYAGSGLSERVQRSCLVTDCLKQKDQYAVFFGGNFSHISMETGIQNGRKLLVIKDSFANCFVPFLTRHFQEIHMLDLRYYTGDPRAFLQDHGITDILVLYELSNLITDPGPEMLSDG